MANADITAIVAGDTRLLDEALNKAVAKPRKVNLSINNDLSGSLGRIRAQLGEFDKSLAASNARVLAFGASAGAMYAVGRSIKELVNSTVQVEKRLTSINSILGASRSEFGRFGNELFRIAQETSSSFDDVADAAEELARQGVGIEETLKRTSSAMKLVRISGVSAVTAVEAMTAALNTNNDVLLTSESLINKLAAVDAKFAVSAAGLTEALKRVGSVAVDAGFSIDELIAAVTSAQQTTARGEAVIGNSLKTIFTRAQRPKVLEDFQSLGIETKNAAGNIRPLKDILIEVAKQYDNLSSAQQSNISELVGGVYQINILKALFRDLGKETSIFGRAFEESFGATDQAGQRVAQLNETLDALFKRFSVNLTKFGSQSGNAAFAPLGKSLLKGMNTVLEGVTSELGDKNDVSGRIMEGLFKGLGNALSGPLLVGGLAVLIKLLRDWRVQGMDAIKTLSGLNRSFHNLEIVTSNANQFLREYPQHLVAINAANKTAEGSTRALTAATADYVKWVAEKVAIEQLAGRASSFIGKSAVAQGVFSAPIAGRGETLQVRRASGGLIPEIAERMGAYAGGYTPGNVRQMNVPGMGRVYYNTAENVRQFPGMEQPAIMPPRNSAAGKQYESNFVKTHGFSPYNAGGLIPFKSQRDAAKEYIFGNESSPGREGMFSKALAASFIPSAVTSATGTSDSRGGKIATEITDALSLGLTIAAFARGKGGAKVAIGAGVMSGLMGIIKQSTNSFNTLDAEVNDLKNKIQKAGDGMGMYGQTLEQLQNAYLDSSVSAIQIVKLQDKLAQTLAGLPEELRRQLMSAKTLEQVQDIGSRYSEGRTSEFQQKELALTLSTNLNSRNFRRGSLIESSEKITEGMGKSKLEGVADIILSALVSSKGLEKIGGAAGLSSGDFFTKLKQGGISGSVTEQLSRVRGSELDVIKSRLIGQAGTRETDMAKIREMMPEKQRFSQQLAALEKQADAARKAIKQTFESIGQMANLRLKMGGRQGIMRATGINEEIQGLGSLMSETSSPDRMAITNYRSQLASNQLKAATETSEVFAELRSGISDLFNQFDLSRMGDIPANVRGGQSKLLSVLGGQNTVGGIGEGAISIFKALGKDESVNDIKKLMADSNEKLVDIQQTLREGNKIAEIQRNIAIQRAEFDRSLKTGGGLSSFLDRGDKYGKMSDIYGAQFGYQSGIFKGQGAIELVRSYLGAGGKATDSGVSGLLGTATEERALDIIETQKDLNRAFAGSGLKLGVPNISEARKLAETQIAAELKTGDSDMERQMAGLERALQSAISSSFGGQMSDAAQVFADVLAGSDTFRLLNSTLEKNTQVLAGLESSLKGMRDGVNTSSIALSARAGGNIPIAAAGYEKMMAKAGGYNPGNVRRAGNLIYNSAERVDYLPGIREPIISPPPGSLAGFLHRQNFRGLGFAASGSLFEGFSLDDIKYESSKSTRDISHPTGYKTEPISGSSKIIDFSGRKIVIVDKGGVKIPFYLSSGQAGKDKGVGVAGSVPKGKWYPFFGIDPNEGWLNKMGGEPMSSHYNSSQLKAIADELDSKLGNINSEGKLFSQVQKETLMKLKVPLVDRVGTLTHANEAVVPKVGVKAYPSKEIASHIKQINIGLNPTPNELPSTKAKVQANIDKIKSKLAGQGIDAHTIEGQKAISNINKGLTPTGNVPGANQNILTSVNKLVSGLSSTGTVGGSTFSQYAGQSGSSMSGVGSPMDWKFNIRGQAQYPIESIPELDNFETWKRKQIELREARSRRASLIPRTSTGQFKRSSGAQFGKFPITGLPPRQQGLDAITRMQQVSGIGRSPLSVVEPGGLSAISELVKSVVPQASPRVIGVSNYGEFPTSVKNITPLPLSAPQTPFSSTLTPIKPNVPLPVQIPGGGMVDLSSQRFPSVKASTPRSYPIRASGLPINFQTAPNPSKALTAEQIKALNLQRQVNSPSTVLGGRFGTVAGIAGVGLSAFNLAGETIETGKALGQGQYGRALDSGSNALLSAGFVGGTLGVAAGIAGAPILAAGAVIGGTAKSIYGAGKAGFGYYEARLRQAINEKNLRDSLWNRRKMGVSENDYTKLDPAKLATLSEKEQIDVRAAQVTRYGNREKGMQLITDYNQRLIDKENQAKNRSDAIKAYQSTSGTRFQQEQFALTQGMSPADRVTYFKQQMTGKYGQWGSQEDYQAGLSRASTDVNRDTLAKRYNITAPGQLDRLHTGLTKAAELGKTKEYVAQLERLYRGVVQPAQKPATAKPEETAGGDKTKLDININMGGNLGIKNTSVEFSEEQYMVINSMIAAVSEGIEKKIKAITDKLPAETRSNVANATPPQAGPSRATPYGV